MSEEKSFSLSLDRIRDFEFQVHFDWEHLEPLLLDEPEPIGHKKGPNAARLLGAAVGNCLSASLLFCLEKSRMELTSIHTDVKGFLERNESVRLRVTRLDVHITIDVPDEQPKRVGRCIEIFEDYCVVTASIKKGIDVNVLVIDPEGHELLRRDHMSS